MSATPSDTATLLAGIAARAGAVVMRHYEAGCDIREKADASPVTEADQDAETLILAELASAFAGVPVVAEEEAAAGRIARVERRFFLVDPLDGTREFISRNGEFTVNIAEIVDGVPVRGVVYAPAKGRMFVGDTISQQGAGAFELAADLSGARAIRTRAAPGDGITAVGSRSHSDAQTADYLKQFTVKAFISAGSSLKFCLVAAGEADIYPRHGRTMEWDTAAGHAVLLAAGGTVTRWDGGPFTYGKPGHDNPPFVARGQV
jgi:3'(2'), 5'-bisphosphate nucleotidase